MKRLFGLAAAGLLVFALAGCKEPQKEGGIPRKDGKTAVVVLAPSAADLMGQTMQAGRVIGVTDTCPASIKDRRAIVVKGTKIDYELLAQLKADIIIYDSSLYSDLDVAKLQATGSRLYDFRVTSLDQYEDTLYRISALIGGEVIIGEYVDKINVMRERYNSAEDTTPVKTMVLMGGQGSYMAAGTKTFQADIVNKVSGTAVGPDSDLFVAINPEAIVQMNPTIIFSPGQGNDILKDSRLQSVDAVKNRRVFDLSPSHLLRPNSQIDLVMEGIGTAIAKYRNDLKK